MDETILEEAKKYLDKVDFIIDLYDMSYVWASQNLLDGMGYTLEEFQKTRSVDLLSDESAKIKYRKDLSEWLAKVHGTTTLVLDTKLGKKVRAEAEYYIFTFKNGHYMAGKGIKHEYLP